MAEQRERANRVPEIRRLTLGNTLKTQTLAIAAWIAGAAAAGVPAHYLAEETQKRISGGPVEATLADLEKRLVELQALKKRTGEADQGWFNEQWQQRVRERGFLHWLFEENEPMLKRRIEAVRARKESGADAAIDFYIYLAAFGIIYGQIAAIAGGAAYGVARARSRRKRDNQFVDVLKAHQDQLKATRQQLRIVQGRALGHSAALLAAKNALERLVKTIESGQEPDEGATVDALEQGYKAVVPAMQILRELVQTLDAVKQQEEAILRAAASDSGASDEDR